MHEEGGLFDNALPEPVLHGRGSFITTINASHEVSKQSISRSVHIGLGPLPTAFPLLSPVAAMGLDGDSNPAASVPTLKCLSLSLPDS